MASTVRASARDTQRRMAARRPLAACRVTSSRDRTHMTHTTHTNARERTRCAHDAHTMRTRCARTHRLDKRAEQRAARRRREGHERRVGGDVEQPAAEGRQHVERATRSSRRSSRRRSRRPDCLAAAAARAIAAVGVRGRARARVHAARERCKE
eukprot:3009431-Prymnesium_polylepis.1